ncbi:MAG: cell division protein ZipA [Methylohalobius crimeensis]
MEMDKTTLRIILAVAGAVLLVGIYLWDRWKKRRRIPDETWDEMESEPSHDEFELEEIDTISINPAEENVPVDADVLDAEQASMAPPREEPRESSGDYSGRDHPRQAEAEKRQPRSEPEATAEAAQRAPEPTPAERQAATQAAKLPDVIQVSVAAPPGRPLQGPALAKAFADLGLEYGDMEIFHAYQGDEIQFSVASLVKPGTFPIHAMDDFQTRGLTLFLQPPLVKRPSEAFERMISACHTLAQRFGGSEWDDRRQPLTAVKISLWRRRLKDA